MRRRPLGKTGIEVTELALGTWGLSGDATQPVTDVDQDRVIDRALALGVGLFETADSYGHGEMERRLAQRLPADDQVRVVTKIGTDRGSTPPRKRFEAAYVREAFEKSRDRLGRDPIDVVLLHNPSDAAVRRGEATGVLEELRAEGRIRAWGVSIGSVEVGRASLAAGAQVLEIAYNAFWSRALSQLSGDVAEKGVGVLARSVLAHGLLAGHWPPHKTFASRDHRSERWSVDELRKRVRQLDALRSVIGGEVMTMRAGALRFVLANEQVTSVVLGPRSSVQLDQLVREAGRGPPYLDDERLTKLATRLRDVGVLE